MTKIKATVPSNYQGYRLSYTIGDNTPGDVTLATIRYRDEVIGKVKMNSSQFPFPDTFYIGTYGKIADILAEYGRLVLERRANTERG